MATLADAIRNQPKPPCDYGCQFRQQCAANRKACHDFSVYVTSGTVNKSRINAKNEYMPLHSPSSAIFRRIFSKKETD